MHGNDIIPGTINEERLTWDLRRKINGGSTNENTTYVENTGTTTSTSPDTYERITLTSTPYNLASDCKKTIDFDNTSGLVVNLPTSNIDNGKLINLRNVNGAAIKLRYISSNVEDILNYDEVKSYVFINGGWHRLDSRMIAFATGNNQQPNATINMDYGAPLCLNANGLAIGTGAYVGTNANYSNAIGVNVKSALSLQVNRGGGEVNLRRTTDEARIPTYGDNANSYYCGRVQWVGKIQSILGNYEMFLGGIVGKRFNTYDNSLITGYLKVNIKSLDGALHYIASYRALTIERGAGANTLQILDNFDIRTINSDPTVISYTIQANTTSGNIEFFANGGSAVQAYDLNILAEFDYIETKL